MDLTSIPGDAFDACQTALIAIAKFIAHVIKWAVFG
jgi:hypothetical protein